MDSNWQLKLIALCSTCFVLWLGFWVFSKKSKKSATTPQGKKASPKPKPEKWVLVGRVSKLIVYPVKSCAGVVVPDAILTSVGLKFKDNNIRDRDFMVVDSKSKSMTMERYPQMSLITSEVTNDGKLHLSAPGMDPITVTCPTHKEEQRCRVKHDHVRALDCGDEVAEWLQVYLGKQDVRLCYHHLPNSQRTFEPYHYECPQFEQSDMGTFHNETAYLLAAQESIDDLNRRLDKDSTWQNWRPTILIDNVAEPFAEINWSYVRFGNNGLLKASAPCFRCPLVTVDNDTGIMPRDGEPLKTLRSMNKADDIADKKVAELMKTKGIMGLRLGLYSPSVDGTVIQTGDPVYAALL